MILTKNIVICIYLSNFAALNYLFLINLLSIFFKTNRSSNESKQKNNIKIRIFCTPIILNIPVKIAAIPKLINMRLLKNISRNINKSPATIKISQINILRTIYLLYLCALRNFRLPYF